MARGAKKPQSRLAGGVQLCVKAVYTLYQGRGMGNIQQLEVVDAYRKLREQLDLAAYAAYFSELVAAVGEERPNGSEAVYRWFSAALDRLRDGRDNPQIVARIWETKVLHLLGASPIWNQCVRCHTELAQETVFYAPGEGGFLCPSCQVELEQQSVQGSFHAGRRGAFPVPSSVPKVLAQFRNLPWERIGQIRLSPNTAEVIRNVLRYQLADYGGLSLKSREFVDSIDALWTD